MVALLIIAAGIVPIPLRMLSLSPDCHLLIERGINARLVMFNDAQYGPYRGSIIGISDGKRPVLDPVVTGFGRSRSLYHRHLRWSDGRTLWTLSVSLLYPLGFALLLPIAWVIRRAWRKPDIAA